MVTPKGPRNNQVNVHSEGFEAQLHSCGLTLVDYRAVI